MTNMKKILALGAAVALVSCARFASAQDDLDALLNDLESDNPAAENAAAKPAEAEPPAEAPAEETPAPAEEKPAEEAPAAEEPAPAEAPAEETPAPAEEKPAEEAPAAEEPAPAAESAPAEEAPAPVTCTECGATIEQADAHFVSMIENGQYSSDAVLCDACYRKNVLQPEEEQE